MCVMGSTESGTGDFSVGSIVWVRRRNGSWWPGKIVGPEELSASHLTSPRSGTPVKLLGREDASVDWYNLEKSKRVKAFRCGEFDDCIEKAESSQGMPVKKREKYARREDAILHALELEKQLLRKQGKLGVEQTGVVCKAKRSKCVYLPAESGESLEYEAAPSNQVEISASPVGARSHAEALIEENTSGFTEDESDSSETDSSESESDSSETEPDMDEEMPLLSEPEVGRYEAREHGIMVGDEPDESTHSGDMSHLYSHDPLFASEAVSKWQLKGKRNIRNLTKRSMDATDGRGYIYGPYSEEKTDWEDSTWEDRSAWNEYWDIKRDRFHPVYDGRYHYRRRPRYLIDVDLKVQASYQKEPVPIVSLMSKLNGKAIIGHPIQIEALEDGSSNSLLSTVDEFGEEAVDNNGGATVPHAWRTARRTANVRVPRPHLSSALDGDEAADDLPLLDEESRPPFKKLNLGSFSNKATQGKRNLLHNSRLPTDRKLSKKVAKKVSLSSSQKTRTLSSIAIEQNFSNKPIHLDSSSCQREGLMKPESSGPTTVACIPVKLVFSRLLEKINRPPSKAASTVLLNSEKERNS
ncbi:hypothetical protein PRUPE_2G324000 [Prunus persica]|uniref:PWWP domain-containing protein n=1 Tax=Prunus persica TaxID=3760 RepID=A0A251QPV9_PRUPE|nr:uncharacterized protein LOC18787553 isoform X3 [Prunus persica]ONI25859.1 hypothetical protein PRUPE_2G324000 [Prunus persica]